jgi:2-octaprenylphenol hydroxylase
MSPRMRAPVDIIVAGGGVVGLAFAALLATGPAAERVRIRVLEARAAPRWRREELDLRVYALSRASQLTLERCGAWEAAAAARVSPYRRMRVFEGASPDGRAALDFDAADVGEPDLGHIVEDSLLRTVLGDVLAAVPHAEIMTGAALAAVAVDAHGVSVRLADGGELRAALLVGADGSDSAVRGLLALPALAYGYAQTALVTHVASEKPHLETAWQRFLPGGPLAFLPLADGRSSVVWSLPEARAAALAAADDAVFTSALQAASAGVLGALEPTAPRRGFPLRVLHAFHYCSQRVALVGDAAHTVHPLAGQGMNLGFGDAAALAAAVEGALGASEDVGDLKVLRRFERARKGANLEMLLGLDALHRLFGPPWLEPLRAAGMHALDLAGPLKRRLIARALGAPGTR